MTFQDLLTYEENCVKQALALPNLNVLLNVHDTYSDCEMCGAYSSTVYEISGDLGDFVSGEVAGCLSSSEDGSLYEVATWLNEELQSRGRPSPELLTTESMDAAEVAYHDHAQKVKYNYAETECLRLGNIYNELTNAFEAFYTPGNIAQLYADFGVTFDIEYEQDPIYDANIWDDDYEQEEEEECQDV